MSSQIEQLTLIEAWRRRVLDGQPVLSFPEVQFRVQSQNGEDGILLYLFTMLGTTNRTFVEVCGGNGEQNNTANLALNHGWWGLMLDGSVDNIKHARKFFRQQRDTRFWPPGLIEAWITRDNINDLIANHGVSGEIDLLSLDMDGNDYWILNALTIVNPRVIVLEYNCSWGAQDAVTQIYDESFVRGPAKQKGLPRSGASLPAFVKLLKARGYRLVGSGRLSLNAYFIRNDLGQDMFPEVHAEDCLQTSLGQYRTALLDAVRDKIDWNLWERV